MTSKEKRDEGEELVLICVSWLDYGWTGCNVRHLGHYSDEGQV